MKVVREYIAEGILKSKEDRNTKKFLSMVKDESDVENLELMKKFINQRIGVLTGANPDDIPPPKSIKGFINLSKISSLSFPKDNLK